MGRIHTQAASGFATQLVGARLANAPRSVRKPRSRPWRVGTRSLSLYRSMRPSSAASKRLILASPLSTSARLNGRSRSGRAAHFELLLRFSSVLLDEIRVFCKRVHASRVALEGVGGVDSAGVVAFVTAVQNARASRRVGYHAPRLRSGQELLEKYNFAFRRLGGHCERRRRVECFDQVQRKRGAAMDERRGDTLGDYTYRSSRAKLRRIVCRLGSQQATRSTASTEASAVTSPSADTGSLGSESREAAARALKHLRGLQQKVKGLEQSIDCAEKRRTP